MESDNAGVGMHQSVLLNETIAALKIQSNGIYIDGTFGRGGHAEAILGKLGEDGALIVIDKDPQAIAHAQARYGADPRVSIVHDSFDQIAEIAKDHECAGKVNGVLVDLGVSSPQLDQAERGFSFLREGPLDMRMDTSQGMTAAEWLASADEDEIAHVLKVYGEERFAKRIARHIVQSRETAPITTTARLAAMIEAATPRKDKHKHPATRSFQAIRIYINRELESLERFLGSLKDVLAIGGRVAVISFHSLEDRIVKQFFKGEPADADLLPDLPVMAAEVRKDFRAEKKIRAGADEVNANPRARSAILRVAERLQ